MESEENGGKASKTEENGDSTLKVKNSRKKVLTTPFSYAIIAKRENFKY